MTTSGLKVVYMGTPQFAVAPLERILEHGFDVVAVVTVPDKPAGRGRQVQMSAVKQFAVERGLKVLQPEKLKDESFVRELESLKPDVMVVVAFRMLPEVVWRIPRLGTFNLHASLLPDYRGAAPINWAIINGEKESGVTTFLIDDQIDTGEILLQDSIVLHEDETAGTLHDKLMALGSRLVVETLDGLVKGTIHPRKQSAEKMIRQAPKIFKADCRIPWSRKGKEVECFIRGLSPNPGAFTEMVSEGLSEELKILEARFIPDQTNEKPGLLYIQNKRLLVSLHDGELEIKKLQLPGKKPFSASEFINGIRDKDMKWKLFE